MPSSRGPQPYADCPYCEWDGYFRNENEVIVVEVLHILWKHPIEYQRLTDKDPEQARSEHAEMLRTYKSIL